MFTESRLQPETFYHGSVVWLVVSWELEQVNQSNKKWKKGWDMRRISWSFDRLLPPICLCHKRRWWSWNVNCFGRCMTAFIPVRGLMSRRTKRRDVTKLLVKEYAFKMDIDIFMQLWNSHITQVFSEMNLKICISLLSWKKRLSHMKRIFLQIYAQYAIIIYNTVRCWNKFWRYDWNRKKLCRLVELYFIPYKGGYLWLNSKR